MVKEKESLARESDYSKRIAPLTASLDAAREECRSIEIEATSKIDSMSRELEVERTALAAQTEALRNALVELDSQTERTTELSAALQESTASLAAVRKKETEMNREIAEMKNVNKEMKRDLEQQRFTMQRLREERDAAVERELHVSMQRRVGSSAEIQRRPSNNLPTFASAARMMVQHARSAGAQPLAAPVSDDEQGSESSHPVPASEAAKHVDEHEGDEAEATARDRQVLSSEDEKGSVSSREKEEEEIGGGERSSAVLRSRPPAVPGPAISLPTFASAAGMMVQHARSAGAQPLAASDSDDEQGSESSHPVPASEETRAKRVEKEAEATARDRQVLSSEDEQGSVSSNLKPVSQAAKLQGSAGGKRESPNVMVESREDVRRRRRQEAQQQRKASADFIAALFREAEREEEEAKLAGAASKVDERAISHNDVDRPESKPVGVGIAITRQPPFRVIDLVAGGAAARSGSIRVGDYILRAGGVDVTEKPFAEVRSLILGAAGSQLTLKIDRRTEGGKHHVFSTSITRSVPVSGDSDAHSRNRLSGVEGLPSGASLVNMDIVERSPFPSRPPPTLSLPSTSPAPPPPRFDR